MLSHERIWAAIDRLAQTHDLTPSGLAKRAGLDSTTFNKSKRIGADGRARWPSTESLSKILQATNVSLDDFMTMVSGSKPESPTSLRQAPTNVAGAGSFMEAANSNLLHGGGQDTIPVLGLAQAGSGGFFDDAGFPAGEGWDQIVFPGEQATGENAYALEITGDSMMPLYRDGDRIIVSPTASVRRGDRVAVKTRDGEVMAKILKRRNGLEVVLASANRDHEDRKIPASEIEWIARILWASQ